MLDYFVNQIKSGIFIFFGNINSITKNLKRGIKWIISADP